MTWKPDICCYHAGCLDGQGSAWAAWRRWGDTVQYLPCSYGEPAPVDAVMGKNVLVADFSWKRPDMEILGAAAASIVVLDHHRSAQAELEPWTVARIAYRTAADLAPIPEEAFRVAGTLPIVAFFDMEKSGARRAIIGAVCRGEIEHCGDPERGWLTAKGIALLDSETQERYRAAIARKTRIVP